ncbi:MAG: SPOR domain-containing protein [Candidatus Binatia bacterium]
MAEKRKGNDGLYYFTRGQLAILVTGITLSSAIIFLLGILVGQRIEERKLLTKDEPLVKIPVSPSASGAGAPQKDELTFYDTLAKAPTGTQPGPGKAVKEVQPAAKPAAKESKPGTQAAKTPAEKVKGKEIKAAVQEVKIVTKGATAASGQKTAEVRPATAEKGTGQRPWAVQVNAFPHERDAKNLVKKLADKGYDAYVVAANIKGRTWYRVRVGRLATREEAKTLQDSLKKKENYTNAITVSR